MSRDTCTPCILGVAPNAARSVGNRDFLDLSKQRRNLCKMNSLASETRDRRAGYWKLQCPVRPTVDESRETLLIGIEVADELS
jgi:hypothetical protein